MTLAADRRSAEPIKRPLTFADLESRHLGYLLEVTRRQMRVETGRTAVDLGFVEPGQVGYRGLRPSHLRLLSMIPAGGTRVSDLAGVAGMTKQGLGQLMDQLQDGGFVESLRDPVDRRVRLVRRTDWGDRTVDTVDELYAALEDRLRNEMGDAAWSGFMQVLRRLAERTAAEPV